MSASNPYWIIWWATIGIGYILYSQQFGLWGVVFSLPFIFQRIWRGIHWSPLQLPEGKTFSGGSALLWPDCGLRCFLIVFAGYFAYTGIAKLKAMLSLIAVFQSG